MSYIDNHLLDDETVIYRSHIHWVIFVMPVVWTLASVVFLLQTSILQLLGYVALVVAVVTGISALITYFTSEYALTNRRVVVKVGLIKRQSLELLLQKVEGIQVNQGIIGRILNYGSIHIIGTGGTRDPFTLIDDPLTFRHKVQEQTSATA